MTPLLPRIAASLLAVACFATMEASADDFRTLTSADGRSIRAKVLKVEAGKASVQLQDGRKFDIPLASLSQADQEALEGFTPPPLVSESGVSADAVNKAIGQELFADRELWECEPSEVAERLSWARESETALSESFRSYPAEDY